MRRPLPRPLAATAASLLAAGLLAGCAGAPARTAAGGLTPDAMPASALVYAAQSALCAAVSVHIDGAAADADGPISYSADFAQRGFREELVTSGQDATAAHHATDRAASLVVGKVMYLQAGTAQLRDLYGVSQAEAEQLAAQEKATGKWIAVRLGDSLGQIGVQASLDRATLCSLGDDLGVAGATGLSPTTIGGQRVVAVLTKAAAGSGYPAATRFAVYLTDDPLLRPVLIESHGGGRDYTWQQHFSHWDEPVRLTPPRSFPVPSLSGQALT